MVMFSCLHLEPDFGYVLLSLLRAKCYFQFSSFRAGVWLCLVVLI